MATQNWVSFRVLELQINHVFSHLTGPILQDDVIIANFPFQRLGS